MVAKCAKIAEEEVDCASRQRSISDVDAPFAKIVSATRMHLPPEAACLPEATEQHLRNYVMMAQKLGVVAAIAVNDHVAAVRKIAEDTAPGFQFHVLHVPCWGAFVPALNALLNFAQRNGAKYILYQSLEVKVTSQVLHRLLDHHTNDTLVVGPVFSGHNFVPGEQQLNGRTSPWNTLALWSVRKLALTGFLCIADGLPPPSVNTRDAASIVQGSPNPQDGVGGDPNDSLDTSNLMGSGDWWEASTFKRQQTKMVPAGVEEVTAIALLQHLHGRGRAHAILLDLPPELEAQLSWSANWGKDEGRAKWHKYKMASKVSRPAAQLEVLFREQRGSTWRLPFSRRGSDGAAPAEDKGESAGDGANDQPAEPDAGPGVHAGTVMHYGESISPPPEVKGTCLAAYGLFYANSTAVLASAFRYLNQDDTVASSMSSMMFVALLIGGVYLPMPASLWLTRTVTRQGSHIAGLALFGTVLLLGNLMIVVSQALGASLGVVLVARLVQGLGSGVLFQARFLLASTSTSDRSMELQSVSFLATDLGLGLGALLPAVTSALASPLMSAMSGPSDGELITVSVVLALVSIAFLIWVLCAFPRQPHRLPDKVRCADKGSKNVRPPEPSAAGAFSRMSAVVWISGTTRVFVQSAVLPVVALSMRDAHWTGNFRQTIAVAAVSLLPMPFEAFASRLCCACGMRAPARSGSELSKLASGAVGVVALLIASAKPRDVSGEDGEFLTLLMRLCEIAAVMIALAMAAPFNASRLTKLRDAERSMVTLEWMKAYVGRMGGPLFAVVVYSWAGYRPLLAALALATAVVTLTA
jgi:MFS family permease